MSVNDTTVLVQARTLGELTIQKSEIKKWNEVEIITKGGLIKEVEDFYNATTYFINPSGYTLKKDNPIIRRLECFQCLLSGNIPEHYDLEKALEQYEMGSTGKKSIS